MSAPPHDTWPKPGDSFAHWSDVLLATQLAALRSGFTGISKRWEVAHPNRLIIRCLITPTPGRIGNCLHMLVQAKPASPVDLDGEWIITILRTDNLESARHPHHTGGVGTSGGIKRSRTKPVKLSLGRVIKTWKSMHLLEATLKAIARRDGRFLTAYPKRQNLKDLQPVFSYYYACVLGDQCSFYIRFVPHNQVKGAGWACDRLCLQHSCSSVAREVGENLRDILEFWPKLKVDGEYLSPTDRQIWKDEETKASWSILSAFLLYTLFAQLVLSNLATDPCLPKPTQQGRLLPPPDPSLTDKLESKRSKLSKALASLTSVRQEIIKLRTKISLASILDNTDEVKKLSVGMGGLETKREKKLKKVEKKKRKIEKIKEKIKAKQMEQKKIEGTKSKSTKSKKDGKGKKEKKKV
ncbi:hypothetical protein JCM5353_001767 [Sporobolomyces roseus]